MKKPKKARASDKENTEKSEQATNHLLLFYVKIIRKEIKKHMKWNSAFMLIDREM
jgi:hypothetical protein